MDFFLHKPLLIHYDCNNLNPKSVRLQPGSDPKASFQVEDSFSFGHFVGSENIKRT